MGGADLPFRYTPAKLSRVKGIALLTKLAGKSDSGTGHRVIANSWAASCDDLSPVVWGMRPQGLSSLETSVKVRLRNREGDNLPAFPGEEPVLQDEPNRQFPILPAGRPVAVGSGESAL